MFGPGHYKIHLNKGTFSRCVVLESSREMGLNP